MKCFFLSARALPGADTRIIRRLFQAAAFLGVLALLGCNTPRFQPVNLGQAKNKTPSLVLREGDVVRVSFPGAPKLNTAPQAIRRDGRISLPLVGEVTAAGKTPAQLESELTKLYASQLVVKAVTVNVESATFSVYVTGAVLKPGRVDSNRPITALEAIMEAGGFDYSKANLKAVTVTRTAGERVEHFTLDLKRVLTGQDSEPFYLKPSDIVFVPERFVWF